MNRTILSQIKRAIRLNLEQLAGQIIESHGAYLSKRDYIFLIRYMHEHSKYPYKVIEYVYYRSAYRWEFDLNNVYHNAIYEAIGRHDPNNLRELLKVKTIDPSADRYGNHPISWAATNENAKINTEIVRMLLDDDRIDPSINNDIAIRFASLRGRAGAVRMLLKDGRVDPSSTDNNAIRAASGYGHIEVVHALLEDGRANPSALNNEAIRDASENGYVKVVQLLLEDDRVDPSDHENLAIVWACAEGHIEVVRMLLADSRVVQAGLARAIARMKNNTEIYDLLMKAK